MTIEREHGGFVVSCDSCSNYLEVDSPDKVWSDATDEINNNNWRTRKVDGEWTHTCDSCLRKERDDQPY